MAIVAYLDPLNRGLVGGHANAETWNAITKLADNVVAAPIGVGQPVARFAGNDKVCRQWASGKPMGISHYTVSADTTTGFYEGENVSIMTRGVMWVAAGSTCTAGVNAGYNPTTDRWSNVAGGYVAVPGVEFDTNNGAAAGMVKIRINIPSA